ncbi:helix-turn-helix domain-containing protein [Pseudobacteriovorax antillogorgiicola]|uniref:Uncharacterized protein n=1 Tax=Pseudobacteriovorax antillogorgiicola TaxID=1513793 RepID=A0A1Y6B9N3_9BACT|nr:helix-turn-helix domain-containing protein [Pseudobacteriovorax antillogorgiicola]TCS58496.1 hypothetical protein EDD56_1029 [Pseudobacteriovorax antillogorgiicola]SME98235.1 hypothetical protein SAMN06296036_102434 [Pseudobacteriovorax antillogorgiicola]
MKIMMDLLVTLIEKWLEPDYRTVAALVRKSGVSESSLRRIMNRTVTPGETNVRKLLDIIATPSEYHEVMSAMFPGSKENKVYVEPGPRQVNSENLDDYYKDDHLGFKIFAATSNMKGYSKAALEKLLGTEGKRKIDKLLTAGALEEKAGRLYSEELFLSNDDVILDLCTKAPDLVRNNLDKLKGYFFSADRYTEEELELIADGFRNLIGLIEQINTSKDKTQNGRPTVVSLCFGSIDDEEFREKNNDDF